MIKKIFKSRIFVIFVIVAAILISRHIINGKQSFYLPSYAFEEVKIHDGADRIFELTGLSPFASGQMIDLGDFEAVQKLNKMYFDAAPAKKNYILFPLTAEEKNSNGTAPLAPVRNGDILVSFSTHTADWRHGHLALVTDSDKGIILEHMSLGYTSALTKLKSWGRYRNFAILRYPDEKTADKAAAYAREKLIDVPYSIFAGLIKKDKSNEESIESSHCSHIVWQAYKAVGVDLDSDGGNIVTPRDVAMSDELEVLQIFGLNPKDYKDRLKR